MDPKLHTSRALAAAAFNQSRAILARKRAAHTRAAADLLLYEAARLWARPRALARQPAG